MLLWNFAILITCRLFFVRVWPLPKLLSLLFQAQLKKIIARMVVMLKIILPDIFRPKKYEKSKTSGISISGYIDIPDVFDFSYFFGRNISGNIIFSITTILAIIFFSCA